MVLLVEISLTAICLKFTAYPVVSRAKIKTVIERVLDLLPVHGICFFAGISRKNVAVPAPLVAFIRNVPLKRKILLHFAYLTLSFYRKSAPAIKALYRKNPDVRLDAPDGIFPTGNIIAEKLEPFTCRLLRRSPVLLLADRQLRKPNLYYFRSIQSS